MNQRKIGIVMSYSNVIIKNIVLLIYTPLLLKYLGKSGYGVYQVANSLISNLGILNLGFSFAYVKFFTQASLKKNQREISKLNGTYLLLFSVISVVSLLVGFQLISHFQLFFPSSLTYEEQILAQQLMVFMVINIAVTFIGSVFEANIMAREQFKFQQSRQIIQSLLSPVLTVSLLKWTDIGAVSIVIIQVVLSTVMLGFNLHFCIKKLQMTFSFQHLEKDLLVDIGRFSFFIFLNQIFNQINENTPTFTLGVVGNPTQVALFSIANQLKGLFFTISQALSSVFIPKVHQIVQQSDSNEELTDLMIKIGIIQLSLLGFILGGFVVIGKYFIVQWVGPGYDMSYYLLISLMLPLLVPLSQNIGIDIQQARNKHMFRSVILTCFAVINIVITVYSIQRFGIAGSTVGYIISLVFGYGFIMNWYYQKKSNLNMILFWKKVIPFMSPVICATILSLMLSRYIPVTNFGNFLLISSFYCVMYLIGLTLITPKAIKMKLKKEMQWSK